MYDVSDAYKNSINNNIRNVSHIKVSINVVDPDAVDDNTIISNGAMAYSNCNLLDSVITPTRRYATLERNRFLLNGSQLLLSQNETPKYYQGYVSNEISDSTGVFTNKPKITITFNGFYNFLSIGFKFDEITDSQVSEFNVVAYNNANVVYNKIFAPTSADFALDSPIPYCNKIEITFNKTSIPNRRVILSYIVFGAIKTFTDSQIIDSNWIRSVDLLSTTLPQNSFELKSIDLNREYNPDSPNSIWEYVEANQKVSLSYGYELDDGSIEWIQGGNMFTTGEISNESSGNLSYVTVKATSKLSQLTDVYYKGVYATKTLYDLAKDVFEFAHLNLLSDGGLPYYIDDSLKSISTNVPLPKIEINKVLQLIANAGRCVIYEDRIGRIRIERLTTNTTNFELKLSNMLTTPIVNKVPPLIDVNTNYTTISKDIQASLSKTSYNLSSATTFTISYQESSDFTYTTNGTLVVVGTPIFYAKTCIVTLNGVGEFEILGKKLIRSKSTLTYNVGSNGSKCDIENELIINSVDALSYAQWVASYLIRRNSYSVADRGYPEIDVLDNIKVDTLFSTGLSADVTNYKLTYNGALSGETTFLTNE